jgi:hypothetical protein
MVQRISLKHLAIDIVTKWPIDGFSHLMVCDLFYGNVCIHITGLLHWAVGPLINDELGFVKMLSTIPIFVCSCWGNPSVKITSVSTKIRTRHHGNAIIERYRCSILLGPANWTSRFSLFSSCIRDGMAWSTPEMLCFAVYHRCRVLIFLKPLEARYMVWT